ncbi:uncharacterized protein LOC141902869 [Tubulanus polymorphus]|uniref:uncharacterized protein LOC141902869 n=1 Tax=Tubulanus polymorphus TaxID=672921 RepID=UPI003DA48135
MALAFFLFIFTVAIFQSETGANITCPTKLATRGIEYDGVCYYFHEGVSCPIDTTRAEIRNEDIQHFLSAQLTKSLTYRIGLYYNPDQWRWTNGNVILQAQGCYKGDNETFTRTEKLAAISPLNCIKSCRSQAQYKFAALQGGDTCLCAKSWSPASSVSQNNCDVPCRGDSNNLCGGIDNVYIYNIQTSEEYSTKLWSIGKPDGAAACGAFLKQNSSFYAFSNRCGIQKYFICSFNRMPARGLNNHKIDQNTYVVIFEEALTWFEARLRCNSLGGSLVSIFDKTSHTKLTEILINSGKNDGYWIGLAKDLWTWGRNPLYENEAVYTAWKPNIILFRGKKAWPTFFKFNSTAAAWRFNLKDRVEKSLCQLDFRTTLPQTTAEPTTPIETTVTTVVTTTYDENNTTSFHSPSTDAVPSHRTTLLTTSPRNATSIPDTGANPKGDTLTRGALAGITILATLIVFIVVSSVVIRYRKNIKKQKIRGGTLEMANPIEFDNETYASDNNVNRRLGKSSDGYFDMSGVFGKPKPGNIQDAHHVGTDGDLSRPKFTSAQPSVRIKANRMTQSVKYDSPVLSPRTFYDDDNGLADYEMVMGGNDNVQTEDTSIRGRPLPNIPGPDTETEPIYELQAPVVVRR